MSASPLKAENIEIKWHKPDPKRPKNVRWVHTVYDEFIKNIDMITEEPIRGQVFEVPFLNAEFSLVTKKISEEIISVSCYRRLVDPDSKPDDGYFLRFYFTISGIEQETISTVMRADDDHVTVDYLTRLFQDTDKLYFSTLKCVVRMIEVTELPGVYLTTLENDLKIFTQRFSKTQLKNMAFLLKRPKFRDIYTGREDPDLLAVKSKTLKATIPYSKLLASYIKAKERPDPDVPEIQLGLILSDIHTGEKRMITEEECLDLILKAYEVGWPFIYVLAVDYILNNFNNDFVIKVLKCADIVLDRQLFKAASDYFLKNRAEILPSKAWQDFGEQSNKYGRSIIHNIQMEQAIEGVYIPPGIFEETTEL